MSSAQFARSAVDGATRARHRTPYRRWDKAVGVALFVLLALTAVQCARLGASGLVVQLAQGEIEQWSSSANKPGKAALLGTSKRLLDSLGYASDNPWSLEGLATLDLARMRASRVPLEALALTRDARARLHQALLRRPTSPFLWANLALSKLYLDQIDGELVTALRNADELGPWEPTVQQTILFVGLAAWQDLDSDARQALTRTVERGAPRNARKMFEIVKSYGRLDLVCAIGEYRKVGAPDCGKAAAATPRQPERQGQHP